MTDDLASLRADGVVDSRGKLCPIPVLDASKGIRGLAPGAVLEVLATDAGAATDIPAWARRAGHEFLGTVQAQGYLRFWVRKGG